MNSVQTMFVGVSVAVFSGAALAAGPAPFFITSALYYDGGNGIETTGTFVNITPALTPPTAAEIAADPDAAIATYLSAGGPGPATATRDAVAWDNVLGIGSTPSRLTFLATDDPKPGGFVGKQSQAIVFNGQAREALFVGRVVTQLGEVVTGDLLFAASESQNFTQATERGFFFAELNGSPITEWGIEGVEVFGPAPRTYFFVSETSVVNGLQVVDLYLHNPSPGALPLAALGMVAASRRRR